MGDLKIAADAGPIGKVKQGYADVFHKIHQTSDFKRDLVIKSLEGLKLPANPTDSQRRAANAVVTAALSSLTNWANSFIDDLNEFSKVKKQLGAQVEDGSDNPFAAIEHISPEDFEAVSNFLQYADAYSLQDAAEAAGFE